MDRPLLLRVHLVVAAVLIAVAALAAVQLSSAYFVSTATSNASVSTAYVSLNPSGTVSYNASGIRPGWSGTFTVNVGNGSTAPVDLRMRASRSGTLANGLQVQVRRASTLIYDGPVSGLPTTYANAPAHRTSAASVAYQYTFSLPDNAANNLSGTTGTVTFTYEARS